MKRHSTALIDPAAQIDPSVEVGPGVIIEGSVRIAAGCRILARAQIYGDVKIGPNCIIGHGSIVGVDPQDLSFDPTTASGVRLGSDNCLREYVTIHRGSADGKHTELGNHNFLMTGAHLGHDVSMGDHNVLANNCLVGGHARIGNRAFLGGGSVFHQFLRIGDLCMVQGNSSFSKDLPPYVMGSQLNRVAGLNAVGLKRAGLSRETRKELKALFNLVYRDGLPYRDAITRGRAHCQSDEGSRFLSFLEGETAKGVCLRLTSNS